MGRHRCVPYSMAGWECWVWMIIGATSDFSFLFHRGLKLGRNVLFLVEMVNQFGQKTFK